MNTLPASLTPDLSLPASLRTVCIPSHIQPTAWITACRRCSELGSSCGRQSVAQCVWVSGLPLGPLTRFYLALLTSSDNYFFLISKAPSLTRKRVCSLQCNRSIVRLLTPNHTLPSHLRLCSPFVASYDSQRLRWRYSNPPPQGPLKTKFLLSQI
jgi:hypothetical protein